MFSQKLFLFVILVVDLEFSFAQKNNSRPNIIFMMADDLGYADLSCYGRKEYQTPNLDKLCTQGMKFMNAYAAAPVCTPTRVAFMTGRYPARLKAGLYEPITPKDSLVGLSGETPTIAGQLKKAGYETYLVGKWHLGREAPYSPIRNGFDYFYGFHAGTIDYISHNNGPLYENEKPVKREGYTTNIWADKAVEIISKQHSKPFFLSVMFNAPHWPWQGPESKPYPNPNIRFDNWKVGGSAEIFADMVKSLDSAVGRIVKAVDDLHLENNTIIIFTSDNGGEQYSDNGVYKGGKMTLWEGGIREPAFVRWTGIIKEKSVTNQVATTMDWTATILSVAGAGDDSKLSLDGIDMMPLLEGKKKEFDRTLYWRIFQHNQHQAVRDGKWKWLQDEKGNEYLFDLDEDPSEKNNVKENFTEIFQRLKNKYGDWEKTVLAPIPL